MTIIGVIEGFFGPQWPNTDRKSYATFLSQFGGQFYIYAPKQDPYLRKKWRDVWSPEYLNHLSDLVDTFHKEGIQFGVGFSPFGLGTTLTEEDKNHLTEKLSILQKLKIDMLGLFFDDMPTNDNLAETQIEALNHVRKSFKGKIVFCPSYYTPDPILDRVFGQRPDKYLEKIAAGVSPEVAIAWTGPKVISPEIDKDHLIETGALFKRRPFIWENLYANDGPKNCKFLKLRPFTGRKPETFSLTEAFGFNMMNQPQLSKILYLSSKIVLEGEQDFDRAFDSALSQLCSVEFKAFVQKHKDTLLTTGLDNISDDTKSLLLSELSGFTDPAAHEVIDWLNGHYNVGSECLTD